MIQGESQEEIQPGPPLYSSSSSCSSCFEPPRRQTTIKIEVGKEKMDISKREGRVVVPTTPPPLF